MRTRTKKPASMPTTAMSTAHHFSVTKSITTLILVEEKRLLILSRAPERE